MKGSDVHSMSDADIVSALGEARQELFNLRFQEAMGRLSNTARLRAVRRDLARLLTVQNERRLWAEYEAGSVEEK